MGIERHHLLFERSSWESSIPARRLRQLPSLIIPMDEDIEQALHKTVINVPLLDRYTAQHTYRELQPARTYVGSCYRLMEAIERGSQHSKTHTLERELAQLTIHAIELQMPFIRSGSVVTEVGGRIG